MTASNPPAARQGIILTTTYHPWAETLASFWPVVRIDNQPVPHSGWGTREILLSPGVHHLHVHTHYGRQSTLGPAAMKLYVPPGQMISAYYRAPVHRYRRGALIVNEHDFGTYGGNEAMVWVGLSISLIMLLGLVVGAVLVIVALL